ncbi:sigma-54 interaction domain-containing protein [Halodesulfovibrio marinisediminis]|uniref:HTH-type transcriptional regulatory protein TyrR n=1 Tax=Halodesulfovibrio marinisediminis DSM 17456 TaxID=1121457 RepID=A0A1N6DVT0_9BACT|nr:sigma 54-interacting transcriptional regulator [Halodesulfovibrio marinisediminis]SIN74896.1 PAS domain S-box-containing protein [Halodesulfovibrio marinisediminis DSM 17456]
MPEKKTHFGLDFATFTRIIDELHDEIIVYDNDYKIVYVNKACQRHYGYTQQEMIGKHFSHFVGDHGCWDCSVLPTVYKLKKPVKEQQVTHLGVDIFTIATPLFDEKGNVEFVPMSVRDDFHEAHIQRLSDIKNTYESPREKLRENLVFRSESMKRLIALADQVSDLVSPCLLLGESGCGKSLLAKYIHENSPRRDKPFVVVNCASIPPSLFESELFGHKKGAFTGATTDKMGLFAKAEGGTLFLDEISELPLLMQAKLLHVVQEKEYRPVGGTTSVKADVKLLAATNRNLFSMVQGGAFREDLYYRLNVFELVLPSLRNRMEDLLPLANYFLNHFGKVYGRTKRFSQDAIDIMMRYDWRGNVRELSHTIERLMVITEGEVIEPRHLPSSVYEINLCERGQTSNSLDRALENVERKMLLGAYEKLQSTRKVAAALNISQSRASRLLRKYKKINQ